MDTLTAYLEHILRDYGTKSRDIRISEIRKNGFPNMSLKFVKRFIASTQPCYHKYLEKMGEKPTMIISYMNTSIYPYMNSFTYTTKNVLDKLFKYHDIDTKSIDHFIICHHIGNVPIKNEAQFSLSKNDIKISILKDLNINETSKYCILYSGCTEYYYDPYHISRSRSRIIENKYNVYLYYLDEYIWAINMNIEFTLKTRVYKKKYQAIIDYKITNVRKINFLDSFRQKLYLYKYIVKTFEFKDLMNSCDYDQKTESCAYFVRLCFAYQLNITNPNICKVLGKDVGLLISYYVSKNIIDD